MKTTRKNWGREQLTVVETKKKTQLGLFMFPPSPITQQSNEAGYIFFILWSIFFFFTKETIEKLLCSVIHSRLGMGPTFLRVTYRSSRLHSKGSTTVLS